jgi:hypothetical protein
MRYWSKTSVWVFKGKHKPSFTAFCNMETTNMQNRECAQTSGTVYSKNLAFFSRIFHFCGMSGRKLKVMKMAFDFALSTADHIDYIEVILDGSDVEVRVMYNGLFLYKWKPDSLVFDLSDGFCFTAQEKTWHVIQVPSMDPLQDSSFFLRICDMSGYTLFCTSTNLFVEMPQCNGTRWVNPSSKSILMPCDGRGGGFVPQMADSKEMKPEHVKFADVLESLDAYCDAQEKSKFPSDSFARTVWRYETAKTIYKAHVSRKHKKQKLFEPQFFDRLLGVLPGRDIVGGISDVAKAIHQCAVNGVDIPNSVAVRLDEALAQVAVLNENISGLRRDGMTQHHTIDLGFGNFFSWIIENRTTVGLFVLSFVLGCVLCTSSNKALILALCSLVGAFVAFSGVPDWIKERWDHIMHMIRGYQQGAFEPQFIDNPVTKALLLFGYLTIFKTVNLGVLTDKFESVMGKLSRAPAATEKFAGVVTFYATAMQSLLNTTLKWVGVDASINWFGDKYPEATTLINEVEEFLTSCEKDSKDLIVSRAAHSSQVYQNQILNLQVKNKADKDFVGTSRLLSGCRSRLAALDKELELRGAGRSVTRVAPKAFLFMGKPGIGKSYLLRTLCTMLLYKLLSHDPAALRRIEAGQTRDYIFTRNSDDKFWEGYYNQMIVYLDEVAMTRDVAGSNSETNEYSSFIKMVNDVCFPLPMANVEKKGTCEFDSDVILGTTNAMRFDIQSINNRDAYDRRWIKIEVEVKPEYGYLYSQNENGDCGWYRPDFDKIRKVMSTRDIAISSFLQFRIRRSLFNDQVGEWMDIHQLIDMMKSEIEMREQEKNGNKTHIATLREIFSAPKEEKEQMAGSFMAQANDCRCKVCKDELNVVFTCEDRVYYTSILGLPDKTLECAFQSGYSKVESKDSYLYTENVTCINEVITQHPTFDICQVMFSHGSAVKSALLKREKYDIVADQIAWYKSLIEKALAFIGLALSALGIYKLVKYLSGDDPAEKSWEVDAFAPEEAEPQLTDLNAQEILACILKRNVYAIGDNVLPFRGHMTFIKDNIFVMPKHFLYIWRDAVIRGEITEISLRRLGDKVNHQVIKFDPKIFLRDDLVYDFGDGQDLCAFYLDNRVMQKHASLRPYLMDDSRSHTHGEMLLPRVDQKTLAYSTVSVPFAVSKDRPISYVVRGNKLSVKNPIFYRFKTVSGDCGLPVAIKDPLLRKEKIFGLHVSGSPSMGVGASIPLTLCKFDAICEHFSKSYDLIEAQYKTEARTILDMVKDEKNWNDLFAVPEDLEVPGKVNLGYLEPPSVPVKTSIVPSPLFKKLDFEPKTKPAWLRPFQKDGKTVDPNAIATTKYHHSVEKLDLEVLDACKDSVTNIILNGPMISDDERMGRCVLSFEEAVEGIAGVDGFDGIPRKTSAGYPRCKYVENKGKRDFFGDCGDYEFDSAKAEELRDSVESVIASAKRGIRGNHVFLDFPKDERRPKAKVDSGKTRKISACPIDLAICIRQYFGCFVQFFMKNRIFNQSAVGVNVFDKQWETIAEYLGTDARIIAGDFSNYDGKLPYAVMVRFLDTVTDFYGDRGSESERVRDVLFQELVNSKHIMNGAVYEWVGSNASGNPLTTVLNSWCNLVLLRYATLKCVDKCNLRDARPFLKSLDAHVRYMVYGDDNLISVDRASEYAPKLTQNAFTRAFEEMGLEYTDENKTGEEISQDRSIEDVSFLKRRWARTSVTPMRCYLSPLDLNTIMESIQWTKKKDGLFDAVRDNVVNMLQELSQHEREVFDEWAPKIVRACRQEMNYVPLPNTYLECQRAVLARDMSF